MNSKIQISDVTKPVLSKSAGWTTGLATTAFAAQVKESWAALPQWVRALTRISAAVGLLSALAQVSILTPFSPVPVTLQTLAVAIIGLSVRRFWERVSAMTSYLIIGFAGAPVFAGGAAGVIAGPSLGYLLGMVLSVAVIGDVLQSQPLARIRPSLRRLIAVYCGSAITLASGAVWISVLFPELSISQVVQMGVLPFLLGDFLKNMVAVSLVRIHQ